MKKYTVHGIVVAAALAVVATLSLAHPPARIGPPDIYPPASITGALNPDVTQANIQATICTAGYTATIRPPSSYTSSLKDQQMVQFGLTGATSGYEEDHLISLELGGNPTSPLNLWPESYTAPGARQKDQTENFLHTEVCNGNITLAEAQKAVVADWFAIYQSGKAGASSPVDISDQ